MDDHRTVVNAYGSELGRRVLATAFIGSLAIMCATALTGVVLKWNGRFEHVFHPIAGLSYEAPEMVNGTPVLNIEQPLSYQRLSANDAYRFNASVPVSTAALPAALPFVLPAMDAQARGRALYCLTSAIYYEAASESQLGQEAVAQVILNRVRHPAFPKTVCGVVFSGSERNTGCQFTFTCDGSRARLPNQRAWARARTVAEAALAGHVTASVGNATHYHTLWVAPYWSPSLVKVANIGAHTFYRWGGSAGLPPAFLKPHAGFEPQIPVWRDRPVVVEEMLDTAEAAPVTAAPVETVVVPSIEISSAPAAPVAEAAPQPQVATPPPAQVAEKSEPQPAAPAQSRSTPRLATPSW